MRVGLGGEVIAAELLPAGGCVPPGNKLVAGGFGDVCPAEVDGAGCGLGVQDGRGEVGVRGGGDGLGPGTLLAVSVDGAYAVVVGDADGEVGMVEGGAGEVVVSERLPAGGGVPPGDQFVAGGGGTSVQVRSTAPALAWADKTGAGSGDAGEVCWAAAGLGSDRMATTARRSAARVVQARRVEGVIFMPFSRGGMGGRDSVMVAAWQAFWSKAGRGRAGPCVKINSIICT